MTACRPAKPQEIEVPPAGIVDPLVAILSRLSEPGAFIRAKTVKKQHCQPLRADKTRNRVLLCRPALPELTLQFLPETLRGLLWVRGRAFVDGQQLLKADLRIALTRAKGGVGKNELGNEATPKRPPERMSLLRIKPQRSESRGPG